MNKVSIFLASPRKQSNSTFLAKKIGAELIEHRNQVQYFNIAKLNIKPCNGCDACQKTTNSTCVINDEMGLVYKALEWADTLLFAFPIYYFTVNAQLKLLIDRLYPYTSKGLAGKNVGIVATHAESGTDSGEKLFQEICKYCNMHYKGCFTAMHFEQGEAENNWADYKPIVFSFTKALRS